MILSFADPETEGIFRFRRSRKLPPDIQQTARRKLGLLNDSERLDDMRVPPAIGWSS